MRQSIIISLLLLSNLVFGQDLEKQKAGINNEVERISKQTNLREVNFSIPELKKSLRYISYQYLEAPKGFVKISRQFSEKKDTIRQTFYIEDGLLIYATEKIISCSPGKNSTDTSIWSGNFYFSKGKLIDHVTLGHGKSEQEDWIPGQEMLTAFSESKRDIQRYKTKTR